MRKIIIIGMLLIPTNALAELSTHTSLAQEWNSALRGKTLTQISSFSSGYGDLGSFSRSKSVTYLCRDGRFLYYDTSTSSIGGTNSQKMAGRWHVVSDGNIAALEVTTEAGRSGYIRLDYNNGELYLDGEKTFVTDDNDVC